MSTFAIVIFAADCAKIVEAIKNSERKLSIILLFMVLYLVYDLICKYRHNSSLLKKKVELFQQLS